MRGARLARRPRVHHSFRNASTGMFGEQPADPRGSDGRQFGRKPPRKAPGGVREQIEGARRAAYVRRFEVRDFEQDIPGGIGDLGVEASHHSGQRDRSPRVCDDQPVGTQLPGLPIESAQGFPTTGAPDDDVMVTDSVVVEGMHRLTQFEHHVVGDVHQVVDRAHAGGRQPFLHPRRRRNDLDVLDQRQSEAATKIRGGDLDRGAPLDGGSRPRRGDIGRTQGGAGKRRDLAGHPEDGQGIRAVRSEVEYEDPVPEDLPERRPRRAGHVEYQDALVFHGQPQFRFRTHHPSGHHPADARFLQLARTPGPGVGEHRPLRGKRDVLSGGNVRRPADDRLRFPALVHGDQSEAVGIRMGTDFQDPPDDHAVPVAADLFDVRDFETRQGQPMGESLDVFRQGNHGFQPPERDAHDLAACGGTRVSAESGEAQFSRWGQSSRWGPG